MSRFYLSRRIEPAEQTIELPREEAHHLARVLRLQRGDAVVVFDAEGNEFQAIIATISSQGATLELHGSVERARQMVRELTVAISPIRPEPMSWLVQKLTELGVAQLAPFVSSRTALPHAGEGESDEARRKRWERVSLAACKQCGRSRPIGILSTRDFATVLNELAQAAPVRLLAWEGGDAAPLLAILQQQAEPPNRMAVIIGPEGGFTQIEYEQARARQFQPVDLGPYILRAETAAVVAAALLLN